jgi:hypothetical protein
VRRSRDELEARVRQRGEEVVRVIARDERVALAPEEERRCSNGRQIGPHVVRQDADAGDHHGERPAAKGVDDEPREEPGPGAQERAAEGHDRAGG